MDVSEPLKINILAIQGSTLGLTLFLCYINAFFNSHFTMFFFGDNTTCLGKDKNLERPDH
jgi:hypothetical protein